MMIKMKKNMKKWLYKMSNSIERNAMPIMTFPGLQLVDATILDVVKDGEAQFRCIEALSNRYPSTAAMTIMDLSVEAEAFGSPINYSDHEVPTVTSRIVYDMESAEVLTVPKVGEGRTSEYLTAAELSAKNIKDRPTFGGIIGPFSLAGRLFDMTEVMIALMLEPETVHIVLEKAAQFLIDFAKAYKNTGANGIIIAEPAAGLLSPAQCDEFSSRYVKRIVEAVQDDYFMVILHNCGNTTKLVSSMLSTGSMGYHFGNAVDIVEIMPHINWGKVAFGNIDPARVFKNGSVEDVREKTWGLLEKTAIYKNFVISSGCDIPPGTPLENIDAFFDTLARFNYMIVKEAG
jgi:uroporphyrinogen decarboxylase